ncbi:MAG: class I SAM-dependent methyltransferase [Bryobacterales bacterium]|nr:class I SAM-dependent methyltransferase [Bryobacterales bacterium]
MGARPNPWNDDKPFSYDGMWLGTTSCQKNINRKISGSEDVGWLSYALERYVGVPRERCRCLLLGSGEGRVLEHLCRNGFTGEIVATDIADRALVRARDRLRGYNNIRYVIADLNTDGFDGRFDLIVAEGVLHHIENLRVCLKRLNNVLAPDGVLIAVEFEGPFRFQLPDEQLRWINAALNVLPKGFRGGFAEDPEPTLPANILDMTRVFYPRASAESIEAFDPSEAISGHIMREALADRFRIIERKPFGGTLLSYMTAHFPFGQANENPVVDAWLRVLMSIEDTLTGTGVLPDEFVFYVLGCK